MAKLPELPPTPDQPMPGGRSLAGEAITYEQAQAEVLRRTGVNASPMQNDPAFAPPGDPLSLPGSRAVAKVVQRDIPIVAIQNSWGVDDARNALSAHMMGIFERSAQLCDSILGDDRVMATLGSRRAGLFGRDIRFRPANDSSAAREVLERVERPIGRSSAGTRRSASCRTTRC